jgi:hypothetical protein
LYSGVQVVSPFVLDETLKVEDLLKLADEKVTPAGGAPPFVASAVAEALRAGKVPRDKLQFLKWGLYAGMKPSRYAMAADALHLPAGAEDFGLRAIAEFELVAGRKDAEPAAVAAAVEAVRAPLRDDPCFARLAASAIVVGVQLKHVKEPAGMEASLAAMAPALRLLERGRVHPLAMVHGVVSFVVARGGNFLKRDETVVAALRGLVSTGVVTQDVLLQWMNSSLPHEAGLDGDRGDIPQIIRTRILK